MSYPETPPRRLSSDANHPDFHPCYSRVGIMFNGAERNDVIRYDLDHGLIWLNRESGNKQMWGEIEPYWRFTESRQMRRAREQWDSKRGVRA